MTSTRAFEFPHPPTCQSNQLTTMRPTLFIALLPWTATLLVTSAMAQVPVTPLPTRGMLSALELGMIFNTTANSTHTIVRKREGLPARLDDFVGTGVDGTPSFVYSELSQSLDGFAPDLDALTTANDHMPIVRDTNGTFPIWQGSVHDWAALFIAVGGTVVGYYFDNPAFPTQYRNGFYTELLPGDYVAGTFTALNSTMPIVAMDSAMGVIETNRAIEPGIVEHLDAVYFSLTSASAASLWATGFLNFPQPHFDGATIFKTEFDLTTGKAKKATVFKRGSDLGLTANDDIDALAIGDAQPMTIPANAPQPPTTFRNLDQNSQFIVFSTVNLSAAAPEELMVCGMTSGVWHTGPLRTSGGNPLVGPAGTVLGSVSAICSKDPHSGNLAASFGIPIDDSGLDQRMGLSLHARAAADATAGNDKFRLTGVLSGWGDGTPHLQQCVLVVAWYGNPGGTLYQLPLRPATADVYSFAINIELPWSPTNVNTYTMYVVTTDYPYVLPLTLHESIHSALSRHQ